MNHLQSKSCAIIIFLLCALVFPLTSLAHGVDDATRSFLENNTGIHFGPFLYIGAKHMVTGYDHLLFLFGVMFFLYKSKDILLYVTMFTIGHSTTLLLGALSHVAINAYLIDAIIGLSVVYKAFDNLGGFETVFHWRPNPKTAVLVFGLFHGLGLATKLQEFQLDPNGLLANLVAFNIGVELGQFLALMFIVLFLNYLRRLPLFSKLTLSVNTFLMCCGFTLMGFQLTGYLVN
ncbi:HupE/UreJ family protein [Sessilibacter corallicola]|uniref:HupE/UreJ family protein n=1 Tax=Sessilibacter corallicola TaxID=2904075 RepID=UPI003340F7DB